MKGKWKENKTPSQVKKWMKQHSDNGLIRHYLLPMSKIIFHPKK